MKTIGYLRLSKDDENDCESISITNQRKIITNFANDKGIKIDDWYVDDGYSGYSQDRPMWQKLLTDLNNDIVGTVIAKDLSRLGRNNAQVQTFLDKMIEANKRVLTVSEGYDTFNRKTHSMTGVYTWMNHKYIEDISDKIRSSIEVMQKEGKWICSLPYGYMHDPHKKGVYYPDPLCKDYVKMIFDMYINGMGIKAIARKLNEQGVPTASTIQRIHMEEHGKVQKGNYSGKWGITTVRNILKNEFYMGTLIQKKTERRKINGLRFNVDKSNQIVHENMHEPIIDKATFELVQRLMDERSGGQYRGTKVQNRKNIFSGKLRCYDCGHRLTSTGNLQNTRYVCSNYNINGTNACSNHAVLEYELTESILIILKQCRDNLKEILKDIDVIMKQDSERLDIDGQIKTLESNLARIKNEAFTLMNQKAREIISNPSMTEMIEEMYKEALNKKYKDIENIENMLKDKRQIVQDDSEIKDNVTTVLDLVNDTLDSKELTKKQIALLVDHIDVHKDGSLDIYLYGDLHDICNNHIFIEQCEKDKMLEETVKEILKSPEYVSPTMIWKTIKSLGHHITYTRYRDLIFNKIFDINVLEPIGIKRGYRLAADKETLYSNLGLNIDAQYSTWCMTNNVTIDIILNISRFGGKIKYKNKKLLF
ncbi:MAG: recombinase family protein [Erysipelotrichaceae bacterium]|nr:recombinase family protein [Erysipelotrichaceae bacterium]